VGLLGAIHVCGALAGRALLVPADSPWLENTAAAGELQPPAGRLARASPRVFAAELATGDVLALVTANLARSIPVPDLVSMLMQGRDAARARLAPLGVDENWCAIVLRDPDTEVATVSAGGTLIAAEELEMRLPSSGRRRCGCRVGRGGGRAAAR